jgi:phosphoglycerate dehydrogenase-like enzyme
MPADLHNPHHVKPKGIYLLNPSSYDLIYGPAERQEISQMVDIYAPLQTAETIAESPAVLAQAEIIISGWGMAVMDEGFLNSAPSLKAVFYGAGSIRGIVTDAFWVRDILIASAYAANAIPVSEFTLSQILFSLKRGWCFVREAWQSGKYPARQPVPGGYGSTVGLISLGMIGRRVAQMLRSFEVKVLAYDPYCRPDEAAELKVELCPLDEVFQRSDVVSLHTPWLKETEGLITGELIGSMKKGATFINTARGAVVRENEMIDVLQQRPDLFAILDVTYPEPPVPGSPLFTLPNVILTPHIAGAMNRECLRMGQLVVGEVKRYLRGEPLQWSISREKAAILA